jgi:hypothetical protein
VPQQWSTVTVTDSSGRRYSLDVLASSTYDAAHLFLTHVLSNPTFGLPVPTQATQFEVSVGGKIYHVSGNHLKKWIERRRYEYKGPPNSAFMQRPVLGD